MVYDIEVVHLEEKNSLQLVLGSMSLNCVKKGIVNLYSWISGHPLCVNWFTHLSHLFVAFLSTLLHTLASNQ